MLELFFQIDVLRIGDEHAAGCMGDREFGLGIHDDRLRGYAACPEHGNFAFADIDGIAELGMGYVAHADRGGVSDMHRRAVHFRDGAGNLDGLNHLIVGDGAHRRDHFAAHGTGRHAVDVGEVHRDVAAHGVVAHFDARLHQFRLEGKRAADHEGDEIVTPVGGDIGGFFDKLSVAVNAVLRKVGCDIAVGRADRCLASSHLGHLEQGAGLGVSLCEQQKIVGLLLWQDDEVRLRISRAKAAGGGLEGSRANDAARLGGRRAKHAIPDLGINAFGFVRNGAHRCSFHRLG